MSDNVAMLQAEALILRLPADYKPRNDWLITYGVTHVAEMLRRDLERNLTYLSGD